MPRRKKYAGKKRRKRMPRRRPRRRRPRLVMGGFPTSKKCLLRYATTKTLNPSSTGAIAYSSYAANGCFDPEIDPLIGGHQPRGFDEWMSRYSHYTVIGSKITVTPSGPYPRTEVNQPATMFGVTLSRDAVFPYSTWTDLAESRFAGPGGLVHLNVAASRPKRKTFSTKKYFKNSEIGKGPYAGDSASNPNELAVFHLWAVNPAGDDAPTQTYTIIIDYIVVFSEPAALPSS